MGRGVGRGERGWGFGGLRGMGKWDGLDELRRGGGETDGGR